MITNTIEIPLRTGGFAIIDECDLAAISGFKWRAVRMHKTIYAITNPKPAYRAIAMHRIILGLVPGQICDHINHNGLDNRRENLRSCNHSENMANSRRGPGKYGFKGVAPNGHRWRSFIGGENTHLGTFDTPELAAAAYDAAAVARFGTFAVTNASLGLV